MTTYEIIDLATALTELNNKDTDKVVYHLDNGLRIDARIEEDGYWSVYLDEYFEEDNTWESMYVSTHSVFSMKGAIAKAIDYIAAAEKEILRNR